MKRTPVQWCGLLGIISLFSYAAAVLFSPLAYPGYQWMSQAVSDLSASNAPSKVLWGQLASLYDICGITSVMMVCVFIQGKLNRTIRIGIYLFAAMNWVSDIGYAAFPLSAQGNAGTAFQDIMHVYVVTALVVLLSVLSLILIMAGGYRDRRYRYLAGWATAALLFMLVGAVGTGIVPAAYFGIPERFSVFAAAGFNAVLGVCLYRGFN